MCKLFAEPVLFYNVFSFKTVFSGSLMFYHCWILICILMLLCMHSLYDGSDVHWLHLLVR